MYREFNVLKVTCTTNPDYNGTYERKEIEAEMLECLGVKRGWISYVLDFLFDDEPEFTAFLNDAICSPNITTMTVRFGDDYVTIRKYV